jgi:hypothetical protein
LILRGTHVEHELADEAGNGRQGGGEPTVALRQGVAVRSFVEIQVADVAREGGLPDFKSPAAEHTLKILLTGDGAMFQDVENRALA